MSTSFNSNPRSPATSSKLQLSGVGGVSRAIRSSSSKKTVEAAPPCNRQLFIFFADFRYGSSWAVISEASRTLRDLHLPTSPHILPNCDQQSIKGILSESSSSYSLTQ
ncbi:hypothetical protein HanXRQr2_Chr13g0570581 [Helianthus annuus]|uniref:Uncharacterized protein n=1 Tax=Helianthus annuus TaxID=4232 RepID=A0A9K3EDK4_HELAN|nr:hypothetical protein HanXRQr2_Chr13g0570581 [Helianthus annuus]KAJ0847787.1 hypothetical protein HanPSC8_Chr13g0549381 [Helianthus annuus]